MAITSYLGSVDITSYFGGVSFGQDTSGYFKLSINGGLAVKAPNGKFYTYVKEQEQAQDNLFEVDNLTFDAADDLIYRIPFPVEKVRRGDLIITSEDPFSAVFARDKVDQNGQLSVLDPKDFTKTDFVQPGNLLNIILNTRLVVKVISLISVGGTGAGALGGITFDNKLLPLLLLLGDKTDDGLAKILLLQALGGGVLGGNGNNLLPLFLLLGDKSGKGDLREILLLTQALEEEGEPEEETKGGAGV